MTPPARGARSHSVGFETAPYARRTSMKIRTFAPLVIMLGSTGCSMQMLEDALGSFYGSSVQPTDDGKPSAIPQVLEQRNLVSDQVNAAAHRDPNLVNAWGLAFNPSGPAWVSDNGTGFASVYGPTGNILLTVTVPPPPGGQPPTAKPTGQVYNGDGGIFSGDRFI